jgi:hypothetical protein
MATILNDVKFHNLIPPGAIKDNASFTPIVLDKQDFHGAKGVLIVIQLGATDVAMAALKVEEAEAKSDANTLTSATDVHDFTSKPGAGADNDLYLVYVTMAAWSKRYLSLTATAGDGTSGTYLAAMAIADRPGVSEPVAAELGVDVIETALA